jgi:hypothetical protein
MSDWEKELIKIIGGFCWSSGGGNGGYSEKEVLSYVSSLLHAEHTRTLKEIEGIIKEYQNKYACNGELMDKGTFFAISNILSALKEKGK